MMFLSSIFIDVERRFNTMFYTFCYIWIVLCIFAQICSTKKIYRVYMKMSSEDDQLVLLRSISPVPITECLLLCGNDEQCERVGFEESMADIGVCELYKIDFLGDVKMSLKKIYQVHLKEFIDDEPTKEELRNFTLWFKEKPTSTLPHIAKFIPPSTKQFSVCFWYYMSKMANKKTIIFTVGDEKEPSSCSSRFQLVTMYGRFYLGVLPGREFVLPDNLFISEKQWYHVCVVKNEIEYRLYVDTQHVGTLPEIPIKNTDHLSSLLSDLRDMSDNLVNTLREIIQYYTQDENSSDLLVLNQSVEEFSSQLLKIRDGTIQSLKENRHHILELETQLEMFQNDIIDPLSAFKKELNPSLLDSNITNQLKSHLKDSVDAGIASLFHTFAVHTNRTKNFQWGITGKHNIFIGGKSLETGLVGACKQYDSQSLRITRLNAYKTELSKDEVQLSFSNKLVLPSEFFIASWLEFKNLKYDENVLLLTGAFSLESNNS